jgi:cupin
MDPLSDLLRVVRLDGAHFYTVEAAAPWCSETVPAGELSPRVLPSAEHLISYHILTDGRFTCQFMLEDHAVRHSYHHLAKIRVALGQ